jgi:hypothetical protein
MLINFTRRESLLVVDDALISGPRSAPPSPAASISHPRAWASGTYIPALPSTICSASFHIGIILGGGSREGLFGVTFKIDGTLSEPRLTVNALSAITPGIFRKIFEFQQSGPGGYQQRPVYPGPPMR